MEPVAALPQRVWEASATLLSVFVVGFGVLVLVKGEVPSLTWMSRRAVRLIAGAEIVVGIGIGVAGYLVNAEPACGRCGHGPWGDTPTIVAMGIWMALLTALAVGTLRKYLARGGSSARIPSRR